MLETAEQTELRLTLRRLFGGASACLARAAFDGNAAYDQVVWKALGETLGVVGLALPERFGGSGYARTDRAAALHEMGRCLLPSPFLASAVLAAETLLAAEDDGVLAEVLPGLALGATTATVALASAGDAAVVAHQTDASWSLTGRRRFVLDGDRVDLLLVTAGAAGRESLFLVDTRTATPLRRQPMQVLDASRPQAVVEFTGTPARLVGQPGAGAAAVAAGVAHATIALAAEQVGGAERCLESAVGYARTRRQFGRPIGSFQAIKHKCADLLIQVESARSAARYAASVSDDPHAGPELFAAAALAGSYCSSAYFAVAAENIQVHGGIGFTWEHDAHLYFRRAKADEVLFGTPMKHHAVLARHLGLTEQP